MVVVGIVLHGCGRNDSLIGSSKTDQAGTDVGKKYAPAVSSHADAATPQELFITRGKSPAWRGKGAKDQAWTKSIGKGRLRFDIALLLAAFGGQTTAIGPNTAGAFLEVLVENGWWVGFGCVVSPDSGVWADVEEDCSIIVFFLAWYGAFFLFGKSCTLERYTPVSVVSFCPWFDPSLDNFCFQDQTACWLL